MSRINIDQARELWQSAINAKHWRGSVLERVMFDWPLGKKTNYPPDPPAFPQIADHQQTVDESEYRNCSIALRGCVVASNQNASTA